MALARACVLACAWRIEPAAPVDVDAWRIVATRAVHLGVRPHTDGIGVALTVQVTLRVPW